MSYYVPFLVAYGVSILAGHAFVRYVVDSAWRVLGERPATGGAPWLPRVVGAVERAFYTAAITQPHAIGFIAIWFGIKAFGVTRAPGARSQETWMVFLLGTLLSLAWGALGAFELGLLRRGEPVHALSVGLAVAVGTLALAVWIRRQRPAHP